MIPRRAFLAAGALLATGCALPSYTRQSWRAGMKEIRATLGSGGRMGFAALDTATGRLISFDADSRYAMCSTFKMILAAAVLAKVDQGSLSLFDEIPFGRGDLLEYAPVVQRNIERGKLSVEELGAAMVEESDNSAANLLLARVGGPEGFNAFVRRCGDTVTRLDRYEPELNTNFPGDVRDTTTAAAMTGLMRATLIGKILSPLSRAHLVGWMEKSTTGRARLRAGLPLGWRVGDKTGTGMNGAVNDVAIIWPPARSPILIAGYISGGDTGTDHKNAAHAAAARLIISEFS